VDGDATRGSGRGPGSPSVATVLSLLAPGLGHVYLLRVRRALAWTALWIALELPGVWLLTRASPALALIALALGGIGLWVVVAIDARRLARSATSRASRGAIVGAFAVILALEWLEGWGLRRLSLEPWSCPSADMAPTLTVGDLVIVDRTARDAAPGDVMVFRSPEGAGARQALRVIGVGGDVIELRGGRLIRNGVAIPRCRVGHVQLEDPTTHGEVSEAARVSGELWVERLERRAWLVFERDAAIAKRDGTSARTTHVARDGGPWVVPAGELFVVGDDRDEAHDGRSWNGGRGGTVARGAIDGRARWIAWRETSTTHRFDRTLADVSGGAPRLPSELRGMAAGVKRCVEAEPAIDE
jgi:signal peptidase I